MSQNEFYKPYDTATLNGGRTDDYRTPFQVDRDRIIHSGAFRNLQSKTQVYLSGEYDFYRTRLTHSIEVAQIGRSICNYLGETSPFLSDSFHIDSDLVEAICLSHDLGHPPFGHGGERTLHELFRTVGGFEGNAQTLRLLTDTLYTTPNRQSGMNPTRAFLDGILKYKALYGEQADPDNHFIYDFQLRYRDFVHEAVPGLMGNQKAGEFAKLSSIECQIMDWSDDTAYCINDIVDGVRAGFITVERMESWASRVGLDAEMQPLFDIFIRDIRRDRMEAVFALRIGDFIKSCSLVKVENPLSDASNRYTYGLAIERDAKRQARFYKRVAYELIFLSAPLKQMEFKGDRIVRGIFEAIADCHLNGGDSKARILPDQVLGLMNAVSEDSMKWRIACDYLANLSDGQARRIYKRLYDPEYASLADLE